MVNKIISKAGKHMISQYTSFELIIILF